MARDYIIINITYNNAIKKYYNHTKIIENKIRNGKSRYKTNAFSTFNWFLKYPVWCDHTKIYNCVILMAKKSNVMWKDNIAVNL